MKIFLDILKAVGGLKFSMKQKKLQKVPVEGSGSWGKFQLGEVPVGGQGPVGGQKFTPSIIDNGRNVI